VRDRVRLLTRSVEDPFRTLLLRLGLSLGFLNSPLRVAYPYPPPPFYPSFMARRRLFWAAP